jgi:RNA polymerase sigma factor (sigma-70 family)
MDGSKLDPAQLIRRILDGDKQAYRLFVEQYQRLVRQIVYRMLPNDSDRDDVSQDVFVKIYQNLSGFQFNSKVSTWVARITYNTCLNHIEKKRVPLIGDCVDEETTSDAWEDPDDITGGYAEGRDLSLKLAAEIDELPVIYGTILSLFHLQEMKYEEIAEILSLPVGTVKSYLFRARQMLKERLAVRFTVEDLCL